MVSAIDIGGRKIGPGHPCFVIAEAGVNHNGSVELARRLIDVAKQGGADAVKFQTFVASKVVTAAAPKADYQRETTGIGGSQLDMLRGLELSAQDHRELMAYCKEKEILFLSSPFDAGSADLLAEMGVPAFKIASGEVTNLPFLIYVARLAKPMIVSTGMCFLSEVQEAVRAIEMAGNRKLVLLHCVSNYPAAPEDANLLAMQTMGTACDVLVGYSDHTAGIEVALAAVALGARVIEKHFTVDRGLPGPDHRASLEPRELACLVQGIRNVELALGHGRKEPAARELSTATIARRSLVAATFIPARTVLTEEMIAIKRPGIGLSPKMKPQLLGRVAKADIAADTLLSLEMLD